MNLYHVNNSNCSERVRMTLEEKQIPWNDCFVSLFDKENLTDRYLEINPKGLVPAIVHDGVAVADSADILIYLEEHFPTPALLPTDPDRRRETLEWVNLASTAHIRTTKTYVYAVKGWSTKDPEDMARYREIQPDKELLAFHETVVGDGISAEELGRAIGEINDTFGRIERAVTGGGYLVGEELSLADLAWAPNYRWLSVNDFDFTAFPATADWFRRMQSRESYIKAIEQYVPPR